MRKLSLLIQVGLVASVIMAWVPATAVGAIIVQHTSVAEFDQIPTAIVETVKNNMVLFYGHTSHGSQIVTGMEMVRAENGFYDFNNGEGTLSLTEYGGDLGNAEETLWVAVTRAALDEPGSTFNTVMWSWCGQVSWATEEGINTYLGAMAMLEQEYPDVKFVYMTGHLDGTGPTGNLYLRNNQIRDYCAVNDKILFDFAEIESVDPDDNYYPDETDACGWCDTWCATHDCPDCGGCAHSHCFNCYRKGKAFWWMTARMAGWGSAVTAPQVTFVSPEQNQQQTSPSASIFATFDQAINPASINTSTFVVNGTLTGKYAGTIIYDDQAHTAVFAPSRAFTRGEVVTVVLTGGITSAEGMPLGQGFAWSFTVAASGGSGILQPDSTYAVGSYPRQVVATDVDNDGMIDLVTGNLGPETITVLHNDGTGEFERSGDYYAGFNPIGLAAADFNDDLLTDIAAVGEDGEYMVHISILFNTGEGIFDPPVYYIGGSFAYDICAADFDNDGLMDMARSSDDELVIYRCYGGGMFWPADTVVGLTALAICAADFNNDGSIDLAGAMGFGDSIAVMMNNGNGALASPVKYFCGNNCVDILAADFTGSGNISLAVVNALDKTVSILHNDGAGVFNALQVIDVPDGPETACGGDFDGDGDMDIVTANSDSGSISLLLNSGTPVGLALVNTGQIGGKPYSASVADFDADGDLDLAVTDFSGVGRVTVLNNVNPEYIRGDANDDGAINIGDAVYIVSYVFRGGPAPQHPKAADANCDGNVNIGDAVYIVTYIFRAGPPPCFP